MGDTARVSEIIGVVIAVTGNYGSEETTTTVIGRSRKSYLASGTGRVAVGIGIGVVDNSADGDFATSGDGNRAAGHSDRA